VVLYLWSRPLAYFTQVQTLSQKWSCRGYYGLTFRVSISVGRSAGPDSIGVWRRLLQSFLKVEWSASSVKSSSFSTIRARDGTTSRGVSSRIWVQIRPMTYITTKLLHLSPKEWFWVIWVPSILSVSSTLLLYDRWQTKFTAPSAASFT